MLYDCSDDELARHAQFLGGILEEYINEEFDPTQPYDGSENSRLFNKFAQQATILKLFKGRESNSIQLMKH
jgi:hypothetical protein